MNENRYELEQRLFDEALQIPTGLERDAFLDSACASDLELRTSLGRLLASENDAELFFSDGVKTLVQLATAIPITNSTGQGNPAIGTQIGPYQILELIDEGGCGSVFLAEQTRPIRRRVALKIIRIGMDTEAVISRFETERQALAVMDHPNIAHVLDAGTTAGGLPFFVMDWVQGSNITDYCDEQRLSVEDRLGLFIKVCQAIQHAHQKGVIHRDIKPANILIAQQDGQAVPKVIDFGIAKAADIPLSENALLTQNALMIGTPAYMSPEQAERGGQEIDTRSDIYSLGVVLYEILTGRPPFDPHEIVRSGMSELLHTLREIEPPLPSVALENLPPAELDRIAHQRACDASALLAAVRGDLDWIVSKSTEKDRSRRYESAHGLAADVLRHLAHEPVIARPPTRRYLLKKLVRRNRLVFASASILAFILLLATAVSTRLYWREREARHNLALAKQQQTSLRHQAEELLKLAETREKITQAVVLLRDADFPAADALVTGVPLIRPTPEGAEVFRKLGDWHATQGRWKLAAERFTYLIEINNLDGSDTPSLDHIRAGTALIEARDFSGYEQFRRTMLNRYGKGDSVISAERTVKMALLLPASPSIMREIEPLIRISAESLTHSPRSDGTLAEYPNLLIWRMVSVALGEYRLGHFENAAATARKCLDMSGQYPSRAVNARILLALTLHALGKPEEARSELATATASIDATFRNDVSIQPESGGWWFDWFIARIHLREAKSVILGSPPMDSSR